MKELPPEQTLIEIIQSASDFIENNQKSIIYGIIIAVSLNILAQII